MSFVSLLILLGGLAGGACGGDDDGPALTVRTELKGLWVGTGTFTNNCVNPACRYPARLSPPSVVLDLIHIDNKVDGTTTIDLPQGEVLIDGNPCGPLEGSAEIFDGTLSGTSLKLISFASGHQQTWELSTTNDTLRGTFLSDVPGCSGLQSQDIALSKKR